MYERDFTDSVFGNFIGSDSDSVLRADGQSGGNICRPGTNWGLPVLPIGDLTHSATFVSNIWHYVGARTNWEPKEYTLIDVSHMRDDDAEL